VGDSTSCAAAEESWYQARRIDGSGVIPHAAGKLGRRACFLQFLAGISTIDLVRLGGDDFKMPPHNELVIYELHIGTFRRTSPDKPGTFDDAIGGLDHLKRLGVNAVEVMPIAEFAGDLSWGYNPALPFAIGQAYGGADGFKRFVKAAHERGIAVILDVVYNHFGPSDLHLWQFDGWSENGLGGIYFYNDDRANTPWGQTRPDYGRPEVRQYIRDNAVMCGSITDRETMWSSSSTWARPIATAIASGCRPAARGTCGWTRARRRMATP
jgi:hypothetical protein